MGLYSCSLPRTVHRFGRDICLRIVSKKEAVRFVAKSKRTSRRPVDEKQPKCRLVTVVITAFSVRPTQVSAGVWAATPSIRQSICGRRLLFPCKTCNSSPVNATGQKVWLVHQNCESMKRKDQILWSKGPGCFSTRQTLVAAIQQRWSLRRQHGFAWSEEHGHVPSPVNADQGNHSASIHHSGDDPTVKMRELSECSQTGRSQRASRRPLNCARLSGHVSYRPYTGNPHRLLSNTHL
jgi:hypothetical protein